MKKLNCIIFQNSWVLPYKHTNHLAWFSQWLFITYNKGICTSGVQSSKFLIVRHFYANCISRSPYYCFLTLWMIIYIYIYQWWQICEPMRSSVRIHKKNTQGSQSRGLSFFFYFNSYGSHLLAVFHVMNSSIYLPSSLYPAQGIFTPSFSLVPTNNTQSMTWDSSITRDFMKFWLLYTWTEKAVDSFFSLPTHFYHTGLL